MAACRVEQRKKMVEGEWGGNEEKANACGKKRGAFHEPGSAGSPAGELLV
jgi:hypothetical protein